MIPAPWQFAILAFGVYRLWRLLAVDDLPLLQRLRDRLTGAEWVPRGTPDAAGEWTYRRRTLAHFLGCAYCSGAWLALAAYTGWLVSSRWALLALAPFALSAVVGLVARNLD